jgi:hypothetical protein
MRDLACIAHVSDWPRIALAGRQLATMPAFCRKHGGDNLVVSQTKLDEQKQVWHSLEKSRRTKPCLRKSTE